MKLTSTCKAFKDKEFRHSLKFYETKTNEIKKVPTWQDLDLRWRDHQHLNRNTLFETFEPRRKTFQADKDFANDQDSVYGIDIVDHIIKNTLTVQTGVIEGLGLDLTGYLFETMNFAELEFLRSDIIDRLNVSLPKSITILNVDITQKEDVNGIQNTLFVSIAYRYRINKETYPAQYDHNVDTHGPFTIGERVASVNIKI